MGPLPVVFLPEDFVDFLKLDISSRPSLNRTVEDFILKRPRLCALIEKKIRLSDTRPSLHQTINSLGPGGLRLHLASLYLKKEAEGTFPKRSDSFAARDLQRLSDGLQEFCREGEQRIFLLAFYFKMVRRALFREDATTNLSHLLMRENLDFYLKIIKRKTAFPDWLLLNLMHFESYLGRGKVSEILRKEEHSPHFVQTLTSFLDKEQKETWAKNLLHFACSIHENDFFLFTKRV